ncbi:MAG: ATP-binding cassette domain-containing protein [Acidimicrobiales bacterium]|nr:ATP-binding cassette domain-containing protein [Acidimicrobiales bacterium]
MSAADPVLRLSGVRFRRNDRDLLHDIDLSVLPGQRWVLLGPNGAGKTSLIRIAGLYEFPTEGSVDILGHRFGHVDIRELRPRIGFNSPALTDLLRPQLTALELVTSALHGSLVPWWTQVTDDETEVARAELARVGCAALAEQTYGTLSSGERQRVLLARTLVTRPALLLLDEPGATLDLVGREQLIDTLDTIAADAAAPPMVLVTHHVEEIPASFTHAVLLRDGGIVFAGPIGDALRAEQLSACFGMALDVHQHGGRWSARRAR